MPPPASSLSLCQHPTQVCALSLLRRSPQHLQHELVSNSNLHSTTRSTNSTATATPPPAALTLNSTCRALEYASCFFRRCGTALAPVSSSRSRHRRRLTQPRSSQVRALAATTHTVLAAHRNRLASVAPRLPPCHFTLFCRQSPATKTHDAAPTTPAACAAPWFSFLPRHRARCFSLSPARQQPAALHRQQHQSQIPRSFVLPITSARHADLPCIRSYLASAVAGFPPHSARRQAILLARLLTGASSPAHQLLSLLSLTSALQEQPAVARPRRAPIAVGIQRHRRHLHPAALAVHTTTIALSSTAAGGRARFACPTPPHDTIT